MHTYYPFIVACIQVGEATHLIGWEPLRYMTAMKYMNQVLKDVERRRIHKYAHLCMVTFGKKDNLGNLTPKRRGLARLSFPVSLCISSHVCLYTLKTPNPLRNPALKVDPANECYITSPLQPRSSIMTVLCNLYVLSLPI